MAKIKFPHSSSKLIKDPLGLPLLNIKDIVDGQINSKELQLYSWANFRNAEHYCVYPGDVLITCRGTQLKVAVVPATIKKAFLTANFIAIRVNKELLPLFLSAYLKTPQGQKSLLVKTNSSTRQILLDVSDFEELVVPFPPLDVQEKIINLAQAGNERYRLNIETANLTRKITNQFITDLLSRKEVYK